MSEALRLADELLDGLADEHWNQLFADAAAELRRLHALNAELVEALKWIGDHDLKGCDLVVAGHMAHGFIGRARAALAKVEASNGS